MGKILDGQDTHMREELQAAERRWERQGNEQEQRLEGRIEELEVRFPDREKDNAYQMQRLAVRVDDTLMKISEENVKASWERRLQEDAIGWRKELDEALAAWPRTDDLTGYTTLVTTEKIVDQLAKLQLRVDEQFKGLQGGLNMLERLYLRQLDQGMEMVSSKCEVKNSLIQYFQVNVLQQLQAVLSSQQAEDRARPPQAVKIGPPRRIIKGLPRRVQVTSGPPDSPSRPGPSRIEGSPREQKPDVEMQQGKSL